MDVVVIIIIIKKNKIKSMNLNKNPNKNWIDSPICAFEIYRIFVIKNQTQKLN